MKQFLPITLIFLFLFSCKDPVIIEPELSMSPPEWLMGNWLHSDSTGIIEKMIVLEDDIVIEYFKNTDKITTSVIDSCKVNDLELSDYVKYNSYYNLEFTSNDDSISLIYYAKISALEIRVINELSPTPKTYRMEEN